MARRVFLGLLSSAGAAILAGCNPFGGRRTFRVRITVEVRTPSGIKTRSSVVEFYASKAIALTSEEGSGFTSGISRGEAIIVDLPSGRIFALLTNPVNLKSPDILGAFAPELWDQPYRAKLNKVGELARRFASVRAELPREEWPMMVRFRDINDPASVELVDFDSAGIQRVTLEATHEEVTVGIEKTFPSWFRDLSKSGARLNGSTSIAIPTNELPDLMSPGSFSTEIAK